MPKPPARPKPFRVCKRDLVLPGVGPIKCLCHVPGKDLGPHYICWWCLDGGHESNRNRHLYQCVKIYTEELIRLSALKADEVYKKCITEAILAWLLWGLKDHRDGTNGRAKEWGRIPGYLDETSWVGEIEALAKERKVPLAPMESVHAAYYKLVEMMKIGTGVQAAKTFDLVRSDRSTREVEPLRADALARPCTRRTCS